VHIVVKTHPGIAFFVCPYCMTAQQIEKRAPQCKPPPDGVCTPLDTSPDSIFEVRPLVQMRPGMLSHAMDCVQQDDAAECWNVGAAATILRLHC
jgi:hypothetical protein